MTLKSELAWKDFGMSEPRDASGPEELQFGHAFDLQFNIELIDSPGASGRFEPSVGW